MSDTVRTAAPGMGTYGQASCGVGTLRFFASCETRCVSKKRLNSLAAQQAQGCHALIRVCTHEDRHTGGRAGRLGGTLLWTRRR